MEEYGGCGSDGGELVKHLLPMEDGWRWRRMAVEGEVDAADEKHRESLSVGCRKRKRKENLQPVEMVGGWGRR